MQSIECECLWFSQLEIFLDIYGYRQLTLTKLNLFLSKSKGEAEWNECQALRRKEKVQYELQNGYIEMVEFWIPTETVICCTLYDSIEWMWERVSKRRE